PWVTKAVLPSGVSASPNAFGPTAMSAGFLVRVLTSMVDTEPPNALATNAVLPSRVIATPIGIEPNVTPAGTEPTAMSFGSLVLAVTSIVATEPPWLLVTNAVLPSGVNATPHGSRPTVMSLGSLVLVLTSIRDTKLPVAGSTTPLGSPPLVTKAVLPSRVKATPLGFGPTAMSEGVFVLGFTSMVDTVPLPPFVTHAALPSPVTPPPPASPP